MFYPCIFSLKVQATQWKKWGNELHKEGKYELMAEYYSLALDFTPEANFEITTALLSNRCLALINLKKFKEALADADRCTKIRPKWFRGHSRRGNCLLPLKRKKEALGAFCKAHTNAVTDKEKQATAQHVITTAMTIEGWWIIGQPKQWLQLSRKALDANDNKKAVMLLNMSLYLSESNTEKSILRQIYHGLSEAHFNLNEHERSIDAGNEYFKLRPIKSEEEAKRWEVRAAHAFDSSAYTFCIDYLNLALKYTPADYKQTFSLLLCRRSQAFQQLRDYERALEDAKAAS
ncbi:PREDICTED: dnaJ homolog subfamily C member 7-like [Acropora digitifera]|uniref:dnaJ homolog subfamily C member 7-like n=1 Tax=Acropora digitifera TaxID=70779 RepID=UPI00077B2402|nr:PREDICTED: dnaJ homolog subfamily C member 7-like [Acropora digitifera]